MASGRSVWQLRTFVVSARAWLLYLRLGVSSVRPERTSLLLPARDTTTWRSDASQAKANHAARVLPPQITSVLHTHQSARRGQQSHSQAVWCMGTGTNYKARRRILYSLDSAGGGTDAWTADGQTDEHDNLGRTAAVPPLLDPD